MTAEINLDQISKYQKNLDNRKDSKVIERAVTHQGILESSEDFTAEGKMTPVSQLIFQPVKLPIKSKVAAAGCLPH